MNAVLIELLNRLELQDLKQLELADQLRALEETFLFHHAEAVDDLQERMANARKASQGHREAIGSHYEDLRLSLSKAQN